MPRNIPSPTEERLKGLLRERILILDGAMGTMIQTFGLEEKDFRGDVFRDHPKPLQGCNDILSITRPDVIAEIHRAYLDAGADIIETNTFNIERSSTMINYGLEHLAFEMNRASAALARRVADEYLTNTPDRPRFVAGKPRADDQVGLGRHRTSPTRRTGTSPSTSWSTPITSRSTAWSRAGSTSCSPRRAFDTLNMKACLFAISQVLRGEGRPAARDGLRDDHRQGGPDPLGPDDRGVLALGLALRPAQRRDQLRPRGASEMRPNVEALAGVATCHINIHPNAGMPTGFGDFDNTPEEMAEVIGEFARNGWLNIVGGCCGTNSRLHPPDRPSRRGDRPEERRPRSPAGASLSGMEPLTIRPETNFIMVGERTNITGSQAVRPPDPRGEV